jgi:ATP-dependent Clp protease ATP-binding subunit ClpA
VLKNLGIDLLKVRGEVEKIVQHGQNNGEIPMGRLPQTPRTKKVIEYAIEEARSLHHNYVGTEHLLLGLLREQEGVAAQVLMNLGLKLEDVREEVLNLLGHNTGMISGAAPERPEEDVFRIAKSLKPGTAETYPVSDEAWDAPTGPPELTADQLQMIQDRIRHLTEQKEVFVAALDFALAARCRDEAEALKRLLAWYERFRGTR